MQTLKDIIKEELIDAEAEGYGERYNEDDPDDIGTCYDLNFLAERVASKLENTASLKEEVYRKVDHAYHVEDVKRYLENKNIDTTNISDEVINQVVDYWQNNLSDGYWEQYWLELDEALRNFNVKE